MSTDTTEKCGADGGQGLGAGHRCVCTGSKGHAPFYGKGHGCSCGAIWADPEVKAEPVRRVREDRTAHWGTCENDDCLTSMLIYPHPDAPQDLPEDTDEWDDSPFFIDCPVCGSNMEWGGTDHPADLLRSY